VGAADAHDRAVEDAELVTSRVHAPPRYLRIAEEALDKIANLVRHLLRIGFLRCLDQ
jgi:hypothetical protein